MFAAAFPFNGSLYTSPCAGSGCNANTPHIKIRYGGTSNWKGVSCPRQRRRWTRWVTGAMNPTRIPTFRPLRRIGHMSIGSPSTRSSVLPRLPSCMVSSGQVRTSDQKRPSIKWHSKQNKRKETIRIAPAIEATTAIATTAIATTAITTAAITTAALATTFLTTIAPTTDASSTAFFPLSFCRGMDCGGRSRRRCVFPPFSAEVSGVGVQWLPRSPPSLRNPYTG
ncbi:hypothetical protein POVWA2_001790 [Plasmodium ovale wallikeri]|uniref:Uncharacterized protein n=1 Tax=Plasmodium ovale wallikeri TaxID=864142 RepID=A0A1A8YHH0_PLAOA|nr:hypothetical protein POVWA2_001790 [Plasmodium ovale wallikeri]